ncbi:hypothetical protein [Alkalicoccobacillus plakortidis]|uniref:Amidohydrolase family protein n=1 Tax=Alkalicoccobacillus plakortidis TaxID=444060 RepID=A0ABT0XEM5_9BACI|nr:hypothetical protein [Alkalicoccobacillus plakortidis]MCM2674345.1 hypothetical protein [Alkalicoccobacillus plakortidis]
MYLLNEALRIKQQQVSRQSYVIADGKIAYIKERMPYWKKWRVDLRNLVLAPAKIGMDEQFLEVETTEERNNLERSWIKQGVTTLAVSQQIKSERSLPTAYKNACLKMEQCSLDYVIGITIPFRLLNPSLLHQCRRLQIPFIQVEMNVDALLDGVPWTRLADALLTYPSMLIPKIKDLTNQKSSVELSWIRHCELVGISSVTPTLIWTKEHAQKSGLYPEKGELLVGSDADYLLYHQRMNHYMTRQARMVATSGNLDYDKDEPSCCFSKRTTFKSKRYVFP